MEEKHNQDRSQENDENQYVMSASVLTPASFQYTKLCCIMNDQCFFRQGWYRHCAVTSPTPTQVFEAFIKVRINEAVTTSSKFWNQFNW
jgi:hypothetical protein